MFVNRFQRDIYWKAGAFAARLIKVGAKFTALFRSIKNARAKS
jgi:hypothetical protein